MKAASYRPEDIRNIVLLGHGGAGKTLLVEAILHRAGTISRMGSVEGQTTTSDFEPEARAHHHSDLELTALRHAQGPGAQPHRHPGTPGVRRLGAGGVAGRGDGGDGGERLDGHRVQHPATVPRRGRSGPRAHVGGEQDGCDALAAGGGAERAQGFLRQQGSTPSTSRPRTAGDVVDCFEQESGTTDFGSVQEAHREMIESVVEADDAKLEAYLSGESRTPGELRKTFIRAMTLGQVVPVLFVSAKTGAGLDDLLHILVEEAPSPVTGRRRRLLKNQGVTELDCDASAPFIAHVFKVTADPHLGQLAMLRVLQGSLLANTRLRGRLGQEAAQGGARTQGRGPRAPGARSGGLRGRPRRPGPGGGSSTSTRSSTTPT